MEVDANQKYLITKYEEYTNSYLEKSWWWIETMVDFCLKNRQQWEVSALEREIEIVKRETKYIENEDTKSVKSEK